MNTLTRAQFEERFDFAISKFDFHKIELVMQALNWKWWGSPDFPTTEEMEEVVRDLYESCLEEHEKGNSWPNCSSGGFYVDIWYDVINIHFIAENESSEGFE